MSLAGPFTSLVVIDVFQMSLLIQVCSQFISCTNGLWCFSDDCFSFFKLKSDPGQEDQ